MVLDESKNSLYAMSVVENESEESKTET